MKPIEQVQILAAHQGALGLFFKESDLWFRLWEDQGKRVRLVDHFQDLSVQSGGLLLLAGYFQTMDGQLYFAYEADDFVQGYPKPVAELAQGVDLVLMMGSFVGGMEPWQPLTQDFLAFVTATPAEQQSPLRPGASRMGLLLREALEGESAALAEGQLTSQSLKVYLKAHLPSLQAKVEEDWQLGDFNQPLLPTTFGEFPIEAIRLIQERPVQTKEILTRIKNWQNYDVPQLEYAANRDLTEFMRNDVSRLSTELKRQFRFSSREIGFDERVLSFPEGSVSYSVKLHNKKGGVLVESLELLEPWLFRPESLERFIESLSLYPDRVEFLLRRLIDPEVLAPQLRAREYKLVTEEPSRLVVKKGKVVAEIYPDKVCFVESFAARLFLPGNSDKAMDLLAKIFGLV